jgi:endonuclease III
MHSSCHPTGKVLTTRRYTRTRSSTELGITIAGRREQTLFHWFMCTLLFSKPIQQEVAAQAFRALRDRHLDTPENLEAAGWQAIVNALNAGHYVRYDESTAHRLLAASRLLREQYGGRVRTLIDQSPSPTELRRAVQQFTGIGPTGADIFVREIEPVYYSGT